MASVLAMPRLSDTMTEGVLVKWHKKEGDKIEPGQILAEIETDKAIQEFESFEGGVILKLLIADGDKTPVGAPIAVIGEAGEDISADLIKLGAPAKAASAPIAEKAAPAAVAPAASSAAGPMSAASAVLAAPGGRPTAATPTREDGRVLASPVARKIAREADIDLAQVEGSGPNGRIIRKDVEAAREAKATQPTSSPSTAVESSAVASGGAFKRPAAWEQNGESKPVSQMRKTIARRLLESKTTVPHFYLTVEVDMDEAIKFRTLVHEPDAGNSISYNDLVIKACAVALKRCPEAHAAWEGGSPAGSDSIRHFERADISVAVSTEEGLITPVIRSADQKSLGTIAKEMRVLAERARNKKLKPEEFTGGTFSISNLGMFGVEEFSAIINPPEGCILAVGSIEKKPVVKNDALTIGSRMRITLSCDHRVVDGVLGAKLLQEIKATLEKPMRLAL
jgi:pyruvate dehydrogenase E2 component (dihydrolipoamide acetyltransferase)